MSAPASSSTSANEGGYYDTAWDTPLYCQYTWPSMSPMKLITGADPESDSDDPGHPTTTPLSEYAGELPDTDTSEMAAHERLAQVTKALSQLSLDEDRIGG